MKKVLFSMLAVAAIASCAKTEPTFVENDSEIKIAPVTAIATKAQPGAISGTTYPTAESFNVYAYWANQPAGSEFIQDETSAGAYLNNVPFVNKTGTTWGGQTTYYWPKNGSLRFAAYSPADLNVAHALATDTYTIEGYKQSNLTDKTIDFLLAQTSTSYTAETAVDQVSVVFEHALSWVALQVVSTEEAANAFTIHSVTIDDVNTVADLTAEMPAKTWSNWSEPKEYLVSNDDEVVTTEVKLIDDEVNGTLLIPQTPTKVTIKYTQEAKNGAPALPNQTVEASLALDAEGTPWEPGKKYVYTVTFDLDEILITPSVKDEWNPVAAEVEVEPAVEVRTASELVAAIENGQDVTVVEDITLQNGPVIIDAVAVKSAETVTNEVVIDLNGKTITGGLFTADADGNITPGNTDSYVFIVKEGGKLTINGDGVVEAADASYSTAVWALGGEVVINGGTYKNKNSIGDGADLIYVKNGGKVYINGGEFFADYQEDSHTAEKYSALNAHDSTGDKFYVKGGVFHGFNPADNKSENPPISFVVDGYASYELTPGVWTVAAKSAAVEVSTTDALKSVISQGGHAVLTEDITMSEILVMNVSGTVLDGNGHKLTSTAGRAINVDGDVKATIKNLEIEAKGQRAINVINGPAVVTVDNVTAVAANYAVNLATTATGAVVDVTNSDLTGLNVVNIAAANSVVRVTDTNLTNVDANEAEGYGVVAFYYTASSAKATVTGGKVVAAGDSFGAFVSADRASVKFIGTEGNTDVVLMPYIIVYEDETAYAFSDFAEALEEAEEGETIVMTQDVTTDSHLNIDKSVNFDMNGHTLTVDVKDGSGDDAIWVRDNAEVTITGNGIINFDNLSESTVYASGIFATGTSKVTIESVNVVAGAEAVFAQSNAKVVINGGTYKSIEHPEFTLNLKDSARATASILVNGGSFYKFNPADNAAEGDGTNFVAEGKTVTADGDWYVVK